MERKMKKSEIIRQGLIGVFGVDVLDIARDREGDAPEELCVYLADKPIASVLDEGGISPDDRYVWSDGGSHDYTNLCAHKGGKYATYKNGSHWASGAAHEEDQDEEADDLPTWLHVNHDADFFAIYHSSGGDSTQEDESIVVYIETERGRRRLLHKIHEQYRNTVREINEQLLGAAGDDEYISVLFSVKEAEQRLENVSFFSENESRLFDSLSKATLFQLLRKVSISVVAEIAEMGYHDDWKENPQLWIDFLNTYQS